MAATSARQALTLAAGGTVLFGSAYLSYHYQRMTKNYQIQQSQHPSGFSFVHNPCRNDQYSCIANCYDASTERDEFYLGISFLRRILLHYHAHGDVLEVGAGTGRNLSLYPSARVRRVLLTDQSDPMLHKAMHKIRDQEKKHNNKIQYAVRTLNAETLTLPNAAFDTVVDTFGLCSYNHPVQVLNEMARVCKPTGKILLLEHGRSHTYSFVTRHLDANAEQHAANWGCVWNRDLDQILDAADVDVEILSRYHFDTTYYVVCRPRHRHQK